ncbi:MAG: hypothetical protein Q8O37_08205 [Sulfuricellaceae bacterium]|nr:hypothetical protein [Sulfuricellaceae bacterium]
MSVKRLSLSLLLAFFLLFAQQGAMRHAVSHLSEALNPSGQEKQLPHQAACDLCGTYADLNGAAAANKFRLPTMWLALPGKPTSPYFASSTATQPYLARAPPAFV